ncbi:MAG: UDP-glucose 4-epimerase GalE [Alphaproteobacteria bacterium]
MDRSGSIIVTGGAGYVGSHVCKALAAHGYSPVAYDDLSTGSRDVVKWGPFELGDIGDRERLAEMFLRLRPVAVLHLAALVVDPKSMFDPDNFYKTNVAGSLNLLRAMAEAKISKLVYCSGSAVYGMPEANPVAETQPLDAITPYGTSMLMTERTLPDFARSVDLDWIALRPFNVAGADPDGDTGPSPHDTKHLIPSAIRAAIGECDGLDVYGADYDTLDGTAVRDFVHVSDVAEAHVSALGRILDGERAATINIGSGQGYSVKQVIESVERISGRLLPLAEAPPRPGDPPVLVADIAVAEEVLGWQPQHTDLDEIIKTAWDWRTSPKSSH